MHDLTARKETITFLFVRHLALKFHKINAKVKRLADVTSWVNNIDLAFLKWAFTRLYCSILFDP